MARRKPAPVLVPTMGKWDPAARNVYFLAGGPPAIACLADVLDRGRPPFPVHFLVATNDLSPDDHDTLDNLGRLFGHGVRVLLDSGVFWLTNRHKRQHGITMDQALSLHPEQIDGFDWLWERYLALAARFRDDLWGIIELDQGGATVKRETRRRLQANGVNPIPVYHPLIDGWEYFDELLETTDRLCFGNVVQANSPTRLRLLTTAYERTRCRDVWVHLLGYSINEWLHACPVESCDSSSWLTILRWAASARERSMLKTVSAFPTAYRYRYDSDYGAAGSHLHSMEWAAAAWLLNAYGWGDHLTRLEEVLDDDTFR